MGTNYFLHSPSCPHCGHADKPLHLGKSSAGWCFGLHVYPEQDLVDWQDIWARIVAVEELGGFIQNEYGDTIDSGLFFFIVWHRSGKPEKLVDEQWLRENHAVLGPYGLARHKIDGRCIGHGEGPLDYIVGDFS
jgi:hypothetical protein